MLFFFLGLFVFFITYLNLLYVGFQKDSKKTLRIMIFPFFIFLKEYRELFSNRQLTVTLTLVITSFFMVFISLSNLNGNVKDIPIFNSINNRTLK